jgi:hypothetical protein
MSQEEFFKRIGEVSGRLAGAAAMLVFGSVAAQYFWEIAPAINYPEIGFYKYIVVGFICVAFFVVFALALVLLFGSLHSAKLVLIELFGSEVSILSFVLFQILFWLFAAGLVGMLVIVAMPLQEMIGHQ